MVKHRYVIRTLPAPRGRTVGTRVFLHPTATSGSTRQPGAGPCRRSPKALPWTRRSSVLCPVTTAAQSTCGIRRNFVETRERLGRCGAWATRLHDGHRGHGLFLLDADTAEGGQGARGVVLTYRAGRAGCVGSVLDRTGGALLVEVALLLHEVHEAAAQGGLTVQRDWEAELLDRRLLRDRQVTQEPVGAGAHA